MAISARNLLKQYFETGKKPTQGQFANLIDSFFHKSDDTLSISNISGLAGVLASKASTSQIASILSALGALEDLQTEDKTSVVAAINELKSSANIHSGTTTGSGATYEVALTPPITEYKINDLYLITTHEDNTEASINISFDGLAPVPLKNKDGGELLEFDLKIDTTYICAYDGVNIRVLSLGGGGNTTPSLEEVRAQNNQILGGIDFNGNTGINVVSPTVNGQIANKEYADQKETNAKTYADLISTDVLRDAGNWDASVGSFPINGTGSAGGIRRGDVFLISVEGTIASEDYEVGDQLRAITPNPGQVSSNWAKLQTNTQQATTTRVGISRMATSTEAKAKLSQTTTVNPAVLGDVITEEKKNVNYQINPIGINEVSIYMENAGQVNSLILAGANTGKLKLNEAGTYPLGAQTFPFAYGAGDRVFVSFNYDNLLTASANVKLKCKDN